MDMDSEIHIGVVGLTEGELFLELSLRAVLVSVGGAGQISSLKISMMQFL